MPHARTASRRATHPCLAAVLASSDPTLHESPLDLALCVLLKSTNPTQDWKTHGLLLPTQVARSMATSTTEIGNCGRRPSNLWRHAVGDRHDVGLCTPPQRNGQTRSIGTAWPSTQLVDARSGPTQNWVHDPGPDWLSSRVKSEGGGPQKRPCSRGGEGVN